MSLSRFAAPGVAVAAIGAFVVFSPACGNGDQPSGATSSGSSTTSSGSSGDCPPCVGDSDCTSGSRCGQLGGDTYCAPDCSMNPNGCASGRTCTPVTTADGQQVSLCVPQASATCGANTSSSSSTSSGMSETCGSLLGPDVMSCCTSCKNSGQTCQKNGCYGGWWCNKDTCKCQSPPSPQSCGSSSSSSSSSSTSSSSGSSNVGPNGGTADNLSFAIVGDTRPPLDDDTANYPKAVIGQIWQDIENANPRPGFAVSTGDYQFSKAYGNQAAVQIGYYLDARKAFSNVLFPAMGNHECTGATASNCGQGNTDGITNNYTSFLNLMLKPIQKSAPYYAIDVNATNGSWTSKFVFIAANAWDSTQASWLDGAMSKSTTYTFVVRHESSSANQAPGVTPSDAIIQKYPYTMLIVGHTHTYYFNHKREVVIGNGGAPLTGNVNYGYVIAQQRGDGAMVFKEYDYSTNLVQDTFAVKADGSNTQ